MNQLLTEMDGFFETKNTSLTTSGVSDSRYPVIIIVIAATNRAEVLDPAILRRFDRQIYVPYPDCKGRMDILRVHAAKTHCRFSTIHWHHLAEQTPHFSGSDLKQVVNDAALLAVRQQSKHIEQGHLLQAIQRARAMKVQKNNDAGLHPNVPLRQYRSRNARQDDKEPPLLHPFLWHSEAGDHGR